MRPSLQRWLRKGIKDSHCKTVPELIDYLQKHNISYGHKAFLNEVLDKNPKNYSAAFFSPEMFDILNNSSETEHEIGADATFSILFKVLFPKILVESNSLR